MKTNAPELGDVVTYIGVNDHWDPTDEGLVIGVNDNGFVDVYWGAYRPLSHGFDPEDLHVERKNGDQGRIVYGALARAEAMVAGRSDWMLVTQWPLETVNA